MDAILRVDNLTKQYADFKLDHVSFSVPKGTIMGLIGENGAGKSTTINAILDLIRKDDGTVTFWGQELSSSKQLKEDIGDRKSTRLNSSHSTSSRMPSSA